MNHTRNAIAVLACACALTPEIAAAPTASPADVVTLPLKTDVGGEVIEVGRPRMYVAPAGGYGALAILARKGVALVNNGGSLTVFDLGSGVPLRSLAPAHPPHTNIDRIIGLAVPPDESWLVARIGGQTKVWPWPFDKPSFEATCNTPCAASHDSKRFACSGSQPEIWDVATRKRVAKPPDGPPIEMTSCRFSDDDRALIYSNTHDLWRWDFAGSGAVTRVYGTKNRIARTAFSERGHGAIVEEIPAGTYRRQSFVIDLASGKASPIPDDTYALSRSGAVAAHAGVATVEVVELGSGKPVASLKHAHPISSLAFGGDDAVLGYVDGSDVRIVDLPAARVRAPAMASRFAGWLAPGRAAIESGSELHELALAGHAWSHADRVALGAPPRAASMPGWATWLAVGPGGDVVGAAPSARHEVLPDQRNTTSCDSKLRVWTAKGGIKTLAMTCPKDDDSHEPGWELGGGWAVAVGARSVTIYQPATGKRVAALPPLPRSKPDKPKLAPEYYAMALAPAGDVLAVVWRRPKLERNDTPGPRSDAMHDAEAEAALDCVGTNEGDCELQYYVEAWSIGAAPKRIWQVELDDKPTGPLAFDHAGKRLLVGLESGEVRVLSDDPDHATHAERFHVQGITRLSVAPGDGWVMSEDAAHEQRLWQLPP